MTLKEDPPDPDAQLERARALQRGQRLDEARALCQALLQHRPDHRPTLNLLAQLAHQQGDFDEALRCCTASLALDASQFDLCLLRASALRRLGRFDDALAQLDGVIARSPDHAAAHNNRGLLLHESLGRPQQALASFERALLADPGHVGAMFNAGNALRALGRLDEAVQRYTAVLALQGAHAGALNNRGVALQQAGRTVLALQDFTRLAELEPDAAHPHFMRAQALHALGHLDDAAAAYERVLALQPRRADAWANLGVVLREGGRTEQALHCHDQALALAPERADLHANRANALRELGRLKQALASCDRAIELAPGHGPALVQALHTRMELCDWDGIDARCLQLQTLVQAGASIGPPFALLAAIDDPALHHRAAGNWARQFAPPLPLQGPCAADRSRVRIGYFSSDFGNHPTSHLLAGVFEQHDRAAFEVFAFAIGPLHDDPWRHRIERGVDRFIDLGTQPDAQALAQVRSLALDVAVDLNGWTRHHRGGLFAARCAPVQIGYLGYLGSTGLPAMDYIVTDAAMVPPSGRAQLSEKVIELPSYQCNEAFAADVRAADGPAPTRAEHGLPTNAVVLASFNSNYKLTPEVFGGWMRVLQRAGQAVLWLYVDHAEAVPRLQRAAAAAGITPERLVIAPALPLARHLARLPLADLMLDTFPYNAGATASNALRAGLPVLTRRGHSMASRMGASLLQAVGLPELVTDSPAAYEDLAVTLATDRDLLAALRARLQRAAPGSLLFDTGRFTRSFEAGCAAALARSRAGLAPDHLVVSSVA